MKEILEANSNITANSKQLEVLKKNFPQCFDKNGNFIIHKMQEIVGEHGLDLSKESYSLNWLGKSYARLLANENPLTLLKEDKQHNKKPENINSENLLIKGDNLEVLKHLSSAYGEQIKMIYIDPPYNTGSDGFVYNDHRKFSVPQLCQLAGIDRDEAKRILEFTASKANSHSAWLTFMYPRLYIARELLKDDGVIFISIDDNEVAQLKMLCDEIFGEENFLGLFIVNSSPSAIDYGHVAKTNDYAMFYSKNIEFTKTYNLINKNKKYKYSDDISGYDIAPLYNGNVAFNPDTRPNLFYPFYLNPNNQIEGDFFEISTEEIKGWELVYPVISKKDGIQRVWRWGKPKSKENINKEILGYKNKSGEYRIVQKNRLNSKMIRSILSENIYSSRRGTAEIQELFGKKVFSYPKPSNLINTFAQISCNNNDTILDFFAGSGTTAHAVMQLNAEDGGNRKHISVQLPEKTDKKSKAYEEKYYTIFDITKARIEKAGIKITQENPDYKGDLGFKIFETTPVFDGYLDEINELDPQIELFDGKKLTDEELEILLTTWKVYDGLRLTDNLQTVELAGYKGHYSDTTVYLMDKGFGIDCIKALITKLDEDKSFAPAKIIVFGYNFDSVEQKQLVEGLNNYSNKKSIELDVLVRY